jgi:cyclophilin family peptidyl-prolyl cis-trans isomerase
MARRERERYTERTKPYRREAGKSGHGGAGASADTTEQNPWRNPVVLVALGALVLAGALAVGVMMGRRPPSQTAAGGTPTAGAGVTAETGATPAADAPTIAPPVSDKKTYTEPVDQELDPAKSYFATIQTPKGDIELQLWPDAAPQHVNSFVFLAREGFFDGLKFHRVVPGFVIQGGDPLGTGTGGPGYSIPAEFNADNPVPHRVGTLAMARSDDPNSAGSQFYIVLADGPQATNLDRQYTVFGHVTKGMDVVKQIAVDDLMTRVTVEEKDGSASIVTPDDIRQGRLPENS